MMINKLNSKKNLLGGFLKSVAFFTLTCNTYGTNNNGVEIEEILNRNPKDVIASYNDKDLKDNPLHKIQKCETEIIISKKSIENKTELETSLKEWNSLDTKDYNDKEKTTATEIKEEIIAKFDHILKDLKPEETSFLGRMNPLAKFPHTGKGGILKKIGNFFYMPVVKKDGDDKFKVSEGLNYGRGLGVVGVFAVIGYMIHSHLTKDEENEEQEISSPIKK